MNDKEAQELSVEKWEAVSAKWRADVLAEAAGGPRAEEIADFVHLRPLTDLSPPAKPKPKKRTAKQARKRKGKRKTTQDSRQRNRPRKRAKRRKR